MKQARDPNHVLGRLSDLGDPIRMRILRLLQAEELSVGEIARVMQLPQSTVSRHLKILARGDWLARRSHGTATYYRVVLDDLPSESRDLWLTVRGQMGESAEMAEDVRRVEAVLAARRTDSLAFFGRLAGDWDRMRVELFGDRFTSTALLSLLDPEWVVADVGCGTGNAAELLAPCVREVVAIDQAEPMLEAARRRLGDVTNVRFEVGEAESLPLEDRSVDAAVSVLMLHHVESAAGAIGEMRRVLRADRGGGIALVVDMFEHDRQELRRSMGHRHMGFSESGMRTLFREAGFASFSLRPLPGEAEGKGPGLFAAVGRIGRAARGSGAA